MLSLCSHISSLLCLCGLSALDRIIISRSYARRSLCLLVRTCVVYDVYMCFYSLLATHRVRGPRVQALPMSSQNTAECSIFIGSVSVALLPHCLPLLSPYCCTRSIPQRRLYYNHPSSSLFFFFFFFSSASPGNHHSALLACPRAGRRVYPEMRHGA